MLFLGLGEWLSGVASSAAGAALKIARTFFFALDTFIYELIINLYNLFETLCTARMLDNSLMKEISDRVGLILGLIMFFYIVFEFVKMMIDPDTLEDKQKGAAAIVKRTLMVIVMLGVSTFAFNSLYTIQRTVIKSNVISKLILPYSIETDKFGAVLSEELMYAFYQMEPVDESTITDADELDVYQSCEGMVTAFRNQIIKSNRFDLGYTCLNEQITVEMDSGGTESQEIFVINFNWLLSPIAGIAVVYFLLMYCISIGVRMIQLTVLEVISPMAIVAYLSPKQDNTFTKWSKIYVSTYIDVFIRIAIINFVIFLIATIFDSSSDGGFIFWESVGNPTGKAYWFFLVVIIIALLAFAKKAPDLIKQLLPEGASKLGFGGWKLSDLAGGKTIGKVGKMGAGIVGGALGGAAIGLLSGSVGGAFGGLFKGAFSGLKGQGFSKTASSAWKSQRDSIKKMRDIKANGGSYWGAQFTKLQGNLGMRNTYEKLEKEYSTIQTYVNSYSSAKKKADSEVDKFASNYKFKDAAGNEFSLLELDKMRNDTTRYDEKQREQFDNVYNKIHGFARDQAMLSHGAVKSGKMVWEDDGSGDWGRIEASVDSSGVSSLAINSEIASHMNYIASSPEAKSATGNHFEKAKAANDIYETKINNKVNDKSYDKAKANAGK